MKKKREYFNMLVTMDKKWYPNILDLDNVSHTETVGPNNPC